MAVTIRPATNQSVVIQPGATTSSVSVGSPVNSSTLAVNQGGSSPSSLIVRKSTGGTLTSLGDVNTSSVQDGFTLVYDSETNKWIAQAVTSAVVSVDGGRY
jgi:hypothetical protein